MAAADVEEEDTVDKATDKEVTTKEADVEEGDNEAVTTEEEPLIDKEPAMINLAFEQDIETLCFTTELTSDPGARKTLREALSGWDAECWCVSILEEIMNFLR